MNTKRIVNAISFLILCAATGLILVAGPPFTQYSGDQEFHGDVNYQNYAPKTGCSANCGASYGYWVGGSFQMYQHCYPNAHVDQLAWWNFPDDGYFLRYDGQRTPAGGIGDLIARFIGNAQCGINNGWIVVDADRIFGCPS